MKLDGVIIHLQVQSLVSSLSTRQLLRISKRMVNNQEDNLYQAITKACLFRYALIKPAALDLVCFITF